MKEKYRYIIARVDADNKPTREQIEAACIYAVFRLYGVIGLSKLRPSLAFYDEEKQLCAFKVLRNNYREFVLALDLMPRQGIHLRPLKTTGTLRKAIRIITSIPRQE